MSARSFAVAVPALNEADRLGFCLQALLDQVELDGATAFGEPYRVVVFANNCTDQTAAVARSFAPRVEVVERRLHGAKANPGTARRRAMDLAAATMDGHQGGVLCTTDADSRPRRDWLAQLRAGLESGAQAVAGAVDFDEAETAAIPFSPARAREAEYAALQAELMARLDPEPHNPWPNHLWAWGANLCVTESAYRRVGGMPEQPLAEDRAFVQRLKAFDVPVRHCLRARVWTSARRDGRAAGGLASLVDDHLGDDTEPCDAALEPVWSVWRRARNKAAYHDDKTSGVRDAALASRLGIERDVVARARTQGSVGAGWAMVEAASPRLARLRLRTEQLDGEITRAKRVLSLLKADGPDDLSDRIRAAGAGLWSTNPPQP